MTADLSQLADTAKQFKALKEQEKMLKERQEQLKKVLVQALKDNGEPDASGHLILDLGDIEIKHQRRESEAFDEEVALPLLEARGIKDKCIVMVPTLDQDAVRASYYRGDLSEADLDSMFPKKVTYALIV